MNERAVQHISWLPAHPSDGSISMNRYWHALHAASRLIADRVAVDCPLGEPEQMVGRYSRLKRAWYRYAWYPSRLRAYRWSPIVHVLDHSSAFLLRAVSRNVRTVVTVHDLIPLRDREQLTESQYRRFRRCVNRVRFADLVVTISNQTARDVEELLEIPRDRIEVIPLGVDRGFFDAVPGSNRTLPQAMADVQRRPIVLSIGSRQRRKNLALLPPVLRLLQRQVPDICLVRVGDRLDASLRNELTSTLGAAAVIELGTIADDLLPAVYSASSVLFFPSTYEGFGLPVLEAMAAGCPVVCSGSTSLPEAGGEAARYFDAHAPDEAAEALHEVLSDGHLRRRMQQEGRDRARAFSWQRHLAGLLDAYARLATDSNAAAALNDAARHLRCAS